MKFTAVIALFLMTSAEASSMKSMLMQEKPAELAEEGADAKLQSTAKAAKMADFTDDEKINSYSIVEENFNGILGMLGTPTSMTDQLHNMFNQIHFNERIMR
jgi:hypothetical protein